MYSYRVHPASNSAAFTMKLSLSSSLYSRSKSTCQNLLKPFLNSTSTLNSSTIARSDSLYRRISPVGDPRDSVVPVLDQWVQEGRFLDRTQLRLIIKELKVYRRFQHALEVCSLSVCTRKMVDKVWEML
ncbi:hypothetical protein RHGRI_037587 [Rhododendron griersonianum]|uniref:Pentatricopeptide repeat-containing protein n=1 Tax=Rhododendron griersonianum TaxID=479676 RepID=A0AAV6HS98_9ERIC|nr:hypothetical protein RHGRI_037587 [Rhododendron griersonianum]